MGLLSVGHIDLRLLPALQGQTPVAASDLVLTGDLRRLSVVVQTAQGRMVLCVFDVSLLRAKRQELHSVTLSRSHICSLMSYLHGTVKAMGAAWETILLEVDAKLNTFAAQQEGSPLVSLEHEFLALLTRGYPRYRQRSPRETKEDTEKQAGIGVG